MQLILGSCTPNSKSGFFSSPFCLLINLPRFFRPPSAAIAGVGLILVELIGTAWWAEFPLIRGDLRTRRASKANRKDRKDLEENINALRSLRSSWFKSSLALWVETHFAVSASQ
jgi:hypothetical protein